MMSENELKFTVLAVPNPFASGFSLALTSASQEKINVSVYDVSGKLVEKGTYSTADVTQQFFGTQLASGFYTAVVTQGQNKEIIKIIKK